MTPAHEIPAPLRPGPHEHGLASGDLDELAEGICQGWDLFLDVVSEVDLGAPARKEGWTAREIVARVGAWPFARGLDDLLADASAGEAVAHDSETLDAIVRYEVAELPDADIVASAEAAAEQTADWLATEGPEIWGLVPTSSPLGPLPLLTVVHAMNFQLAVAALDLEPAGAQVPEELLDLGFLALVDTVGALAARADVPGTFTAHTPQRTLGVGSLNRRWHTADLAPGTRLGPGIEIGMRSLLDLTSGNGSPAQLVRTGDLRVHDFPGVLRLAPALEGVPGVPPLGASAVGRAIHVVDAVGGMLGRFRR